MVLVMVKVGLLNYGVGNLGSLTNALSRVGAEAVVINEASSLKNVDALILPGVGSFDAAARRIMDFVDLINGVRGSIPIMGICLGLQLMFESSDEGVLRGLGWYGARVRRLNHPRLPHIGWGRVKVVKPCSIIGADGYFYFMHSYAVLDYVNLPYAGISRYGGEEFLSVLCDEKAATYGTQFHPEKSSRGGLIILSNFVKLAKS